MDLDAIGQQMMQELEQPAADGYSGSRSASQGGYGGSDGDGDGGEALADAPIDDESQGYGSETGAE